MSNCESLQTSSKNVASTTTRTRLAEIMKICFDIRQRDGAAAAAMEGHVVIAISYRDLGNWFKGKESKNKSSSGKGAI